MERGREATAPSIIRVIQIVQRGEEVPHNGGIVLPENVKMQPFRPKGLLNSNLNVRVFIQALSLMAFQVAMLISTVATQA
jgi:hypothetical protein